jgi:hypothetical protein
MQTVYSTQQQPLSSSQRAQLCAGAASSTTETALSTGGERWQPVTPLGQLTRMPTAQYRDAMGNKPGAGRDLQRLRGHM